MFAPGNHVMRLLLAYEDVIEAQLLERYRDSLVAKPAHGINEGEIPIGAGRMDAASY